MTISAQLLPAWLITSAWLLMALCLPLVALRADWSALRAAPERYHLLYGGVLACVVLWLMSVNTIAGLWLHLLGMTSLALVLGWRFSVLAGTVAILAYTWLIGETLAAIPVAWLLTVAIPATVSTLLAREVHRRWSRNLFVYVLGAGFGGGILCGLALALAGLGVLALAGQETMVSGALESWPLITLMLFPEGFINGMVMTTLAVFYPDWVRTYEEVG
ncbi:hypothetical protein DWB85_00200 [Seongchinamella sediminis]|uniref:Uncharacterized protein n=1 Tax=Seongchinamella sediminis TaxID=2283635 RepID=A0A3L7E1C6_9GAMM|nr:energy-coupling factor ABC transporter permease [Seongchinamella sediminis]RLQ23618.1 hypothetical protein DWB85_00200 [Seongchinamella sediminis]